MSALYSLTLSQARAALLKGECSVTELTQSCLGRIEATEPKIHACISIAADKALEQAKALDAKGRPDAATFQAQPLWGIPLTLKDIFCTEDMHTTCASRTLQGFTAFYDAHVVSRLKDAGSVIVAKTNMDEFAMGSTTEHSFFGPSKNPWNTLRVPGGSSGGSAASVAAGQAFGSLGTDSGGSIRQPAALCGCVGLKPTYGRVSRYGAVAFGSSLDQIGPMARTVEDCAIILEAIAGYDSRDATSSVLPVPAYSKLQRREDLKGVRLGVPREFWSKGLDADVEAACRNALNKAEEAGATLVPLSMPTLRYAVSTYYILGCAEASTNMARFDGVRYGKRAQGAVELSEVYTASRSLGFGEEVKRRIMLGTFALSSGYYDAYYHKAAQVRRLIRQDYDKALAHCDALIAPTTTACAWEFGRFSSDPVAAYQMDILTVTLNLAGLPGLALPVGLSAQSNLPVGIQLMGREFDEAGLLNIGHTLEGIFPALGVPAGL